MPKRIDRDQEKSCENCVFFLQHYIRLPDEEMLIFKKSRYGSCIHIRQKITQANSTCAGFAEKNEENIENFMRGKYY